MLMWQLCTARAACCSAAAPRYAIAAAVRHVRMQFLIQNIKNTHFVNDKANAWRLLRPTSSYCLSQCCIALLARASGAQAHVVT
jgi:hypothetical protein